MPKIYANNLNSSWLSMASYDTDDETLTVTTNSGQDYTHENVPQDIFEGLRDADSPGAYYHANIKGKY